MFELGSRAWRGALDKTLPVSSASICNQIINTSLLHSEIFLDQDRHSLFSQSILNYNDTINYFQYL